MLADERPGQLQGGRCEDRRRRGPVRSRRPSPRALLATAPHREEPDPDGRARRRSSAARSSIAARRARGVVAPSPGRQRQRPARGDPCGGTQSRHVPFAAVPEQRPAHRAVRRHRDRDRHEHRGAGRRRRGDRRARGDEDGARGDRRGRRGSCGGSRSRSATRSRRVSCWRCWRPADTATARAHRRPRLTATASRGSRGGSARHALDARRGPPRGRRQAPRARAGAPPARTSTTWSTPARSSSTGR